jgi:hypothetical protein
MFNKDKKYKFCFILMEYHYILLPEAIQMQFYEFDWKHL